MKFSGLKSLSPKPLLKLILKPIVLVVLIALVGIGTSVFFFRQYQQTHKQLENLKASPQDYANEQTQKLISEVGKLIELPQNEQPTVATITDTSKLKDQPFFANSENGDRVLVYVQAKKAILYRPSINKVIDVAPLNINSSPSAQTAPVTTPTPAK